MPAKIHTAKEKNNNYEFKFQSGDFVLISDFEESKQSVQSLETKVDWTGDKTEGLAFPEKILKKLPAEVRKTKIVYRVNLTIPPFLF